MEHDELDDKWEPTKIKIPKVKSGLYRLVINVTDVDDNKFNYGVTLKKQEVAGFTIPHGTTMIVHSVNLSSGSCTVTSEELNKLLRMLYLDSLKTKK